MKVKKNDLINLANEFNGMFEEQIDLHKDLIPQLTERIENVADDDEFSKMSEKIIAAIKAGEEVEVAEEKKAVAKGATGATATAMAAKKQKAMEEVIEEVEVPETADVRKKGKKGTVVVALTVNIVKFVTDIHNLGFDKAKEKWSGEEQIKYQKYYEKRAAEIYQALVLAEIIK